MSILRDFFYCLERITGNIAGDIKDLKSLLDLDKLTKDKLELLSETFFGDLKIESSSVDRLKLFIRCIAYILRVKGTKASITYALRLEETFGKFISEIYKDRVLPDDITNYFFSNYYGFIYNASRIIFTDDSGNLLSPQEVQELYKKLEKFLPVNVLPLSVNLQNKLEDEQFTVSDEWSLEETLYLEDAFPVANDIIKPYKIYDTGEIWGCGSCQTLCQACQTFTEYCYISCQIFCQTTCEGECESICQNYCQSSCEAHCQTTCQIGCETICQTNCETGCETVCETTCEFYCESLCETACQSSEETWCALYCEVRCEYFCETYCESLCETACQCTWEFYCRWGCEIICQSQCETACESACELMLQLEGCFCQNTCETVCQSAEESLCTTLCEVRCESVCELTCQYGCEVSCTLCCMVRIQ